jgi:hypothetical protein
MVNVTNCLFSKDFQSSFGIFHLNSLFGLCYQLLIVIRFSLVQSDHMKRHLLYFEMIQLLKLLYSLCSIISYVEQMIFFGYERGANI